MKTHLFKTKPEKVRRPRKRQSQSQSQSRGMALSLCHTPMATGTFRAPRVKRVAGGTVKPDISILHKPDILTLQRHLNVEG